MGILAIIEVLGGKNMFLIDWIVLGVAAVTIILGLLLGFGKLLKMFTSGIVGILISIVVTYFLLGIVASWGFVQDINAKLLEAMQNSDSGFVNFLLKIGIEKIILAVVLFIAVQFIRIFLVRLLKYILEIERPVMMVINKVLGAVFALVITAMIVLVIFHIVDLVGGNSEADFRQWLTGALRMDWVFDNNPLQYVIARALPQ